MKDGNSIKTRRPKEIKQKSVKTADFRCGSCFYSGVTCQSRKLSQLFPPCVPIAFHVAVWFDGTGSSLRRFANDGARPTSGRLKSTRSMSPWAVFHSGQADAVKDFRACICSAKSLSARVTYRRSHLPGVTLKCKATFRFVCGNYMAR